MQSVLMVVAVIAYLAAVAYAVGPLTDVHFHRLTGKIALEAAGFDVERIIPLYAKEAMPGWFAVLFMLTLLSAVTTRLGSLVAQPLPGEHLRRCFGK